MSLPSGVEEEGRPGFEVWQGVSVCSWGGGTGELYWKGGVSKGRIKSMRFCRLSKKEEEKKKTKKKKNTMWCQSGSGGFCLVLYGLCEGWMSLGWGVGGRGRGRGDLAVNTGYVLLYSFCGAIHLFLLESGSDIGRSEGKQSLRGVVGNRRSIHVHVDQPTAPLQQVPRRRVRDLRQRQVDRPQLRAALRQHVHLLITHRRALLERHVLHQRPQPSPPQEKLLLGQRRQPALEEGGHPRLCVHLPPCPLVRRVVRRLRLACGRLDARPSPPAHVQRRRHRDAALLRPRQPLRHGERHVHRRRGRPEPLRRVARERVVHGRGARGQRRAVHQTGGRCEEQRRLHLHGERDKLLCAHAGVRAVRAEPPQPPLQALVCHVQERRDHRQQRRRHVGEPDLPRRVRQGRSPLHVDAGQGELLEVRADHHKGRVCLDCPCVDGEVLGSRRRSSSLGGLRVDRHHRRRRRRGAAATPKVPLCTGAAGTGTDARLDDADLLGDRVVVVGDAVRQLRHLLRRRDDAQHLLALPHSVHRLRQAHAHTVLG
eukprot:Rhum_TRINITY_DN2335_c0_g1::Rhum_TRINITY_DN2335_c0_g1_i1::g.6954::m.6954